MVVEKTPSAIAIPEPIDHVIYMPEGLSKEDIAHLDQKTESYQDEIYKIMLQKKFDAKEVPLTLKTINILNID